MLAGELYDATDPALLCELARGRGLVHRYNMLDPSDETGRRALLKELLGKTGENFTFIQPFYCDYGTNIEIGENFFANYCFTVLDEAKVTIGDNVFIAPNVSIYTAGHPIDPAERKKYMRRICEACDHREQCMDRRQRHHYSWCHHR